MWVKRLFDLLVALVLLIPGLPMMAVVAVLIRLNTGEQATFTQQRIGYRGQVFTIYKFRTMNNARDENGELLSDDERLTPLGRVLRKLSLDELPQLFNILKGEMSLVGPRPLLIKYMPYYTEREQLRHTVRPGITGLAQVNGRNTLGWNQRLEYDAQYVENWSLWLDIKILWLTVEKVLKRDGVIEAPDTAVNMYDLDIERGGGLSQ